MLVLRILNRHPRSCPTKPLSRWLNSHDTKTVEPKRCPFIQAAKYGSTVFLIGTGIFVGYHFSDVYRKWNHSTASALTPIDDGRPSKRFNFVADVVEKTSPAVISIGAEVLIGTGFMGNVTAQSCGSGFFVTSDGIAITNAHVVANNRRLAVTTWSGQKYPAHVLYMDEKADLALIKVDAKNLPHLQFAKSSESRPGEFVVAMGSPFTLSNTITSGIISSNKRKGEELGLNNNMEYIQTDAPINVGNSGGPLVNLDGSVVGINTLKVTSGISFAIPSDYAKIFLDSYLTRVKSGKIATGHVSRYIGVTMLTLNKAIIDELHGLLRSSTLQNGVLILRVMKFSPAYRGGLQSGDIITSINGKRISSADDVYAALEKSVRLHCEIYRENMPLRLTIEAEESSFE